MTEREIFRIDGKRQLFVDKLLIEEIRELSFKIHQPIPREKVLELNKPWEGSGSWGPTVIKDGDNFRMWYRALGDWAKEESVSEEEIVYFTAFAESSDGRNWNRPNLGHIEFEGTRENNIVFDRMDMKNAGVFLDNRPSVDPNTRFKAVGALGSGARPSEIHEMSFYSVQNYRRDNVHIRRFSMREDGIISMHASGNGGEVMTKPVIYKGEHLEINYSTSAAGSIQVELLDMDGSAMEESVVIFGDEIGRIVKWKKNDSLGQWQDRPVRLRFNMIEADIYSFRFVSDSIGPEN